MYNTSQNYKAKVLNASTQHELNIYIDGNKIEPNHIIDFKQTIELFNNNEFCLGCTPEIDIEFEIDRRDLPETYNEVYIETGVDDEIISIGYFTIQSVEDDEFKVKIKATDYMKKFADNNYDGSNLTYPASMLEVLKDICTKTGVELGSASFINSDKEIAVYDNTVSARTYLGYIAEQAGGIAVIGRDGKLYIRQIGQDVINFDINLFGDYKWGDKFKVSKVSYEDGIQDYKFGDETADTIYINQNNMYIVDKEQVKNIYNQIKDFEIYSFEGETIIDPAYDIGDILVIDGKRVIYQGELEYVGKFKANIKSKIQAKTEQESMQTKQDNSSKIKRVQSEINQIDGKITQLAQETTERIEQVQEQTDLNTDEIAKMGSTKTDEGTELEIDASNNPAHIKIWGKTEQATRSGKNKFTRNINSYMVNTPSDTETSKTTVSINDDVVTINPGTTNYSGAYYNNSIDGIAFAGHAVVISFYAKANANKIILAGFDDNRKNFSLTTEWQRYYHIVDSLSNVTLGFYSMGDKSAIPFSIKDIQIEIGTSMTEYEPYGASPSPDYPSRIRNVGDNVNLSKGIKNGLYLNSNGSYTSNDVYVCSNEKIKVKPSSTIAVSNEKGKEGIYFIIELDNDGNFIKSQKSNSSVKNYIFTIGNSTEYILMDLGNNSNPCRIENVGNFKIEYNILTPYTPYGCGSIGYKLENEDKTQSKTIVFPLSEGQLLHKRGYINSTGIHQKRKTLVLSGTEDIYKNPYGTNSYEIRNIIKEKAKKDENKINIISNCFKGISFKNRTIDETNLIYLDTYEDNVIIIRNTTFTTVDELKSYLAEQYVNDTPVIVEYELEEEIVTPLTPEQQKELDSIETFKGTNYIYCIDEIIPEKIELEYYPNTPYNDTLINKDTFDKVTSDMSAQINIKANEVETSVKESTTASILTLLNNGYLTAEQVNALVNGNAEDIATVKKQLTQTVTSSQMQIEIAKAIEGGVSYLKNTLFTIDENGMAIATSEDEFNALYNNKGMYLYSFEQLIAKFDVSGATIEGNLILKGELTTPNLRMMNVSVSGVSHTHIHWIGG